MLSDFIGGLREDDDRPALPGVRRGELARLVRGYAVALQADGLEAGDTVALAVRPGARSLATLLAAYHLGLRIAVVDPTAGPDVVRARLALAQPRLVLADAAAQAVASWAAPLARRAHLALPSLTSLAPVRTVGRRLPGSAPALRRVAGAFPRPYEGEGDAVVVFTSGTTSRPRAVVHTRASISAGMTAVRDLVRPVPGRPVLGGTFFVLLPSLASGAPVAPPTGRNLRRLRPQAVYLTPPQVRAALAAGSRFDDARVYSGSAPVSAALLSALRRAGAAEAWGVYALTEVFPAAAVEAAEKGAFSGSGDLVGELLPGVSARVSDGQLLLGGPTAADRYLGSEPFGWVATGDIGRVDGRTVVLGGRAKDMILRDAENIYPGLYEPSLHVAGVELALLVGVPAGDGDERVVALVQPAAGVPDAEVRAALRGPLERMGSARPDDVVFGRVPLAGRSRKPDRTAASALAAALSTRAERAFPRRRRLTRPGWAGEAAARGKTDRGEP
ncbi:fatty-acyl-CoA synthase [Paractinoplanes abujensis]|uniref:Acyl-CoA synthetase (AMP-forming)/AMP-acid ligase II n=1 Tax=Paractinoplanes abujensis TaxID=882441 RepID=A0A7W7G583_9ACTN|nr:class I adenylate-forming enzyme family protein [Actinoplanes abujensis]MBB4698153.1 acyl-CoA synthetase (AMP-forming)/AMP-acid ligase II [Actinoplanes abujensis]GID19361.1 fatty-acyl-CoA synthase [Actinoplanes abujensis]